MKKLIFFEVFIPNYIYFVYCYYSLRKIVYLYRTFIKLNTKNEVQF